jgi:membrane dipeptidase
VPKQDVRGLRIDALELSAELGSWDRRRFLEWRQGGLDCVHVTLAVFENAVETLRNLGALQRQIDENRDLVVHARRAGEIDTAVQSERTALIFGFQNTSPFEDSLDLVWAFHSAGVRVAQLTYNVQNSVGSGCWEDDAQGLSGYYGRSLIREMNQAGMLVDLSHCNERTCSDAIEASDKPVAITHGNPREFVGDDVELFRRNRSNRVLQALVEKGGVIGLSPYPRLAPMGKDCTLEKFCDMVAWTVDLLGIDHVGIGTDFVRGYDEPGVMDTAIKRWRMGRWSREVAIPSRGDVPLPTWMSGPADFGNFEQGLEKRGFSPADRQAILGGNWYRLFGQIFG